MAMIDPGGPAPAFTLSDQHGVVHTLDQYAGRPLVLYFYPRDDTSGCTKQACQFRDAQPGFEQIDAPVLGVSPDDVASHARFAEKHGLNFPLLADPPPAADAAPPVCDAYGVWQERSMYGKRFMGVVRTTYLIDGKGRVARRWDQVKVPGHDAEVLDAVRSLRAAAG